MYFADTNSLQMLFVYVVSCVFIGPSHKKIKFFVFSCRRNKKVYC
jgi:hypothetical protein